LQQTLNGLQHSYRHQSQVKNSWQSSSLIKLNDGRVSLHKVAGDI